MNWWPISLWSCFIHRWNLKCPSRTGINMACWKNQSHKMQLHISQPKQEILVSSFIMLILKFPFYFSTCPNFIWSTKKSMSPKIEITSIRPALITWHCSILKREINLQYHFNFNLQKKGNWVAFKPSCIQDHSG